MPPGSWEGGVPGKDGPPGSTLRNPTIDYHPTALLQLTRRGFASSLLRSRMPSALQSLLVKAADGMPRKIAPRWKSSLWQSAENLRFAAGTRCAGKAACCWSLTRPRRRESSWIDPSSRFPPLKHSRSDLPNQGLPNLLFSFQMAGRELSPPSRPFASALRRAEHLNRRCPNPHDTEGNSPQTSSSHVSSGVRGFGWGFFKPKYVVIGFGEKKKPNPLSFFKESSLSKQTFLCLRSFCALEDADEPLAEGSIRAPGRQHPGPHFRQKSFHTFQSFERERVGGLPLFFCPAGCSSLPLTALSSQETSATAASWVRGSSGTRPDRSQRPCSNRPSRLQPQLTRPAGHRFGQRATWLS